MNQHDKSKNESERLLFRFVGYLHKALDYTMINYCREQRRQRAIYNALIQTSPNAGDTEDIYSESGFFKDQFDDPFLNYALNKLNRRYRYILYARILEERSFEEIGHELGLHYHGVAAIYYRALHKIREELRKANGL